MTELLTLLINLDGSDDRLKDVSQQMANEGLEFERFPAFDARGTKAREYPEYSAFEALAFYGRELNGGEVGCYFSHLQCLARFLESDAKYALIVEDDLVFEKGFGDILRDIIAYLDSTQSPPWDALNFGEPPNWGYETPIHQLREGDKETGLSLCLAHLFPLNTHCILWNREGAQAFLANYGKMWNPVDHAMRHLIVRRGRGLCLSRPITEQSDAPSDIDRSVGEAGVRQKGEGRWYWFNVWRIKRLEKIVAKRFRRRLRATMNTQLAGQRLAGQSK